MDVIFNDSRLGLCKMGTVPEGTVPILSQGEAWLNLLSCLGSDMDNPPLADLLRQSHDLTGEWRILSPILWQATHNDALIIASGNELELTETESRSWFELFKEHFKTDEMPMVYHSPNIWLVNVDNKPELNSKSLNAVKNKSLMAILASLDSTMYWQKILTECQMFIASQNGLHKFNGIWIWGGSKLDTKSNRHIITTELYYSIAKGCSAKVSLLTHETKLDKDDLLFIPGLDCLTTEQQQRLKNFSIHWYWNDTAYTQVKKTWWRSLVSIMEKK